MLDEQSTNSGSVAQPSNSLLLVDNSKSLITINAAAQLLVKLMPINYPSWRVQFIALLIGYDLLRYVDGTYPYLEKSNTLLSTLTYNLWLRQDQLLLHAILASFSKQVVSLIASAPTSKAAWDKLKQLYAN